MRDAESTVAEELCGDGWLDRARRPAVRHPAPAQPAVHRLCEDVPPVACSLRTCGSGCRACRSANGPVCLRCRTTCMRAIYGSATRARGPAPGRARRASRFRPGSASPPRSVAVDEAAGWLPAFASALHRDARAPVNLTPIAGLERRLHHLQGDVRLALRGVRESVLQHTARDWPHERRRRQRNGRPWRGSFRPPSS